MDLCRTKNYGMSADPNNNLWFLIAKDFGKRLTKEKVCCGMNKKFRESTVAPVMGENVMF